MGNGHVLAMTHKQPDGDGRSRRSLLRAVGAAGVGALAVGATAEPAAAKDVRCPRSDEHWATAEWPDTIPDPLELGGTTASVHGWQTFLQSTADDRGEALAKQLLATVVNFHYRMPFDPACTDRRIEALGYETITDVKGQAHGWLNWSRFGTDRPQHSWTVVVDGEPVDGQPVMEALERFNTGGFEALDCDCADASFERPEDDRQEPDATRSRATNIYDDALRPR